jgi:hypothetical protein
MARLTADQWRAIRQAWEFDPSEPSYADAANRASEKFGFKQPTKAAIGLRRKAEGWERRGSLAGVNQAAHRIADRIGAEDKRESGVKGGGTAYNDPGARPDRVVAEHEERHTAELRRAEIRVRHRKEWQQIAVLRQESLKRRESDLPEAFNRAKLAKIMAESLSIQQTGEAKSWGMDETVDADRLRTMTDQQLEALVAGKKIT